MLIRIPPSHHIPESDVTPEALYWDRRAVLAAMAAAGAMPALAAAAPVRPLAARRTRTLNEDITPFDTATNYNNFYEFGLDKEDPARNAGRLKTRPWTVRIDGACAKPQTLDIDRLIRLFPLEERVYRMRCVEGWSMVIPWVGFPLAALLKLVEPTAKARYVAFETLFSRANAGAAVQRLAMAVYRGIAAG